MQFCNLTDKEFKVADLNKLNELQENKKRQLNKIRKTIHEQNKLFNKKIEVIKNDQIESLKNSMKITKKKLQYRIDQVKYRINDLKVKT